LKTFLELELDVVSPFLITIVVEELVEVYEEMEDSLLLLYTDEIFKKK